MMTEAGGDPGGIDEGLERGLRALYRTVAVAPAPDIDWARVWADVGRRRRRRRVLVVAGAASALGVVAAVLLLGSLDGGRFRGDPGRGAGGSGQAAGVEYRLFAPAPRVRVLADPGAGLRLESPERVALDAGTAWIVVDPAVAPARFAVTTPDATLVVRGTRFAVRVEPGKGTAVSVFRGAVEVRAVSGVVALGAGGSWTSAAVAPAVPANDPHDLLPDRVAGGSANEPRGGGGRPTSCPHAVRPATSPAGVATVRSSGGSDLAGAGEPAAPHVAPGAGSAMPPGGDRVPAPVEPGPDDGDAGARRARELYDRADRALAEGRQDEAARLLALVADQTPGSTLAGVALMDLGARYLRAGNPEAAADAYRRYLEEFPRGSLRGEACIAACRIERRAAAADRAAACYAAYLAEYPDGPYAGEALRYVRDGERP